MSENPVDIEVLLQHRAFVRALARRLVRDDARADDVVQDTYVTALQNPPRHAGSLRAWLATVVRKMAWTHNRSERRRLAREKLSSPAAAPPTPAEVLERANWHQRLVNLVMELDEPYRSTLLLRFFEDLNSSEIADLQGVPAGTVRTRVSRGLSQLRSRLDERTPGGRAKWLAGMIVLGWPKGEVAAAAAATATAGKSSLWPFAAAAAVGLVAVTALVVQMNRSTSESPPRQTRSVAPPVGEPTASRTRLRDDAAAPLGHLLDVTVLADGRPMPDARVVVARRDGHPWRFSAYDRWIVLHRARADHEGCAHFDGMPQGYIRVLAVAPGYERGDAYAFLPQELAYPVVIELRRGRPAQVIANTEPIELHAVEPNGAPWLTWFDLAQAGLGRDGRVVVSAEGYEPSPPRRLSDTEPLRVDLTPLARTMAWPVVGNGPAEGTVLAARRATSARGRTGHVHGGAVVVDGHVPELVAIAPDESFARLDEWGSPVSFAEPPRVTLLVRDTTGAPLSGIHVRLHAAGNPIYPDGYTDGSGAVTLPVYAAERVSVRVREGAYGRFREVRRYDPVAGDRMLSLTLPRARPVRLRVRGGLPEGYEVYAGQQRLEPFVRDGDLRFHVRARGVVAVHLLAPGFVPVTRIIDPLPLVPAELDVVPHRAGSLVLDVVRAAADQPYSLELVDAEEGVAELRRGPWRFRLYPGPDHVVRETMLPPGRFYVRDRTSGITTDVFHGGGAVHLRLDLTEARKLEWIRGTVHGLPLRGTVVMAGKDFVQVARDGSFAVPWRGTAIQLFAQHARAGSGPVVTVDGPRTVTLELAPPHHARVRLDPAPAVARARVRVGLLDLDGVLEDGTLRFAGYVPRRTTVWFDVPGYAPVLLPDVQLRDGEVDLGTLALRRGSAVRFRVVGRPGETPPELTLSAQALTGTRYQRSTNDSVLAGLGAGTFQVTAWERFTGTKVWSGRVEVDGTNDREVEIDLR